MGAALFAASLRVQFPQSQAVEEPMQEGRYTRPHPQHEAHDVVGKVLLALSVERVPVRGGQFPL